MTQNDLAWQSKLVLLLVLPFVGTDLVLESNFWLTEDRTVVIGALGLSALLGLVTWKLRAATPEAALAGAAITANLMFSTVTFPYQPWHTAIVPVLAVSLLAFGATRIGRSQKERLGTAEARKGRSAAQIAANLGIAALVGSDAAQIWAIDHWQLLHGTMALRAAAVAALAEAAADTVSSEIGQVFGGQPFMITTLRRVEPGGDGAVSIIGTVAGIVAGTVISALGAVALRGDIKLVVTAALGSVFGLLFDSLLGAIFERPGWLNNDAVNFLSTASAAAFALACVGLTW